MPIYKHHNYPDPINAHIHHPLHPDFPPRRDPRNPTQHPPRPPVPTFPYTADQHRIRSSNACWLPALSHPGWPWPCMRRDEVRLTAGLVRDIPAMTYARHGRSVVWHNVACGFRDYLLSCFFGLAYICSCLLDILLCALHALLLFYPLANPSHEGSNLN